MIKTFINKELLEIRRDKKLLLSSILLPFILLPLIGVILYASVSAQPPIIAVINNNSANTPYVNIVTSYIKHNGGIVITNSTQNADVVIVFPNEFYQNISNISRQAFVYFYVLISSNQNALDIANNALYTLLLNISNQRIEYLKNLAHVNVTPSSIRNPIYVVLGYRSITGKVVSSGVSQLASFARIIALVLFPSATPVVFYLLEGITGERERKTLESLLATPLSIRSFIISKLFVAIILGIFSSLGDIVGTFFFISLSSYAFNISVSLTFSFLIIIVLVYLISILLTGALSLIFLFIFGGSTRNIQIINFIIISFGMIASFVALFINPSQLTFPLTAIYGIPYVQLSLGLLLYVFGSIRDSIFSLSATMIVSVFLILLVSRYFNSERLLLK